MKHQRSSFIEQAWASLHLYWVTLQRRRNPRNARRGQPAGMVPTRSPILRGAAYTIGGLIGFVALVMLYGTWRLSNGPLSIDVFTPFVASAVQERVAGGHRVEIGGTQLERDENGRTALRIRDVVVRDRDGAIVATAPKAEVGFAGFSLFGGHLRTERLSLIGAEMAVRVEDDGQISVLAGDRSQPVVAKAPVIGTAPRLASGDDTKTGSAPGSAAGGLAGFLAWIERLDALGLDGGDLSEVGLKHGNLVIEDKRKGKRWTFANINLALTRPREGGVALNLSSNGADGLWSITATAIPRQGGGRSIEAVVRDVSPKDILLALRLQDAGIEADVPLSGVVRAEIAADGSAEMIEGRVIAGAGFVGEAGDPDTRLLLDEAQVDIKWDAAARILQLPIEVSAGKNRALLVALVEAPQAADGSWRFSLDKGRFELGGSDNSREAPLVLDKLALRASLNNSQKRLEIEKADFFGPSAQVMISGALDYGGAEPYLTMGVSGGRMTVASLKRLWPVFIKPPLRKWVNEQVLGGTVDRLVIKTKAPLNTLRNGGPPVPDDGLTIDLISSGAIVRPLDALPMVRDSEVVTKVVGRKANVAFRGTIDMPSGKRMSVVDGSFTVADTGLKQPPAKVRMRVEGSMEAAAELTAMEPIRAAAGAPFDPATTRGSVAAQVAMEFPLREDVTRKHITYNVEADISNFAADKYVRGQKAEANALRIVATQSGMLARGEVKIGGVTTSLDYRKPNSDADADLKAVAVLDENARAKLGLDLGNSVAGPVPVKFAGKVAGTEDRESRFVVEADLTQAKVMDLLPGWTKPVGRQLKSSFVLVDKADGFRIEDLVIEGAGTVVKGAIEADEEGDLVSANFPVFNLSDGDKASLKAERGADGTMRMSLRGDVYDARGFVKSALSGSANDPKNKRTGKDFELEIKGGAIAGHHGEALRNLDLRIVRRNGQIRTFSLSAKLGRDASLSGDMRPEAAGSSRQVLFLETNDAGAFFRFTDTYPRVGGGRMWITIDPPTADRSPQHGVLNIRDFNVRGEAALERIAASQPADSNDRSGRGGDGVSFARMRVEFTRVPGQLTIRDGVVYGASIGATMDGQFDFTKNNVQLRGTFVPAYALNNMLARVPVLGFFLGGGQNEGLVGVTYEVVGSPNAPTLRVNPISAVAPGFLRKLFEFRSVNDGMAIPPAPIR